jgi:hypothetical protein
MFKKQSYTRISLIFPAHPLPCVFGGDSAESAPSLHLHLHPHPHPHPQHATLILPGIGVWKTTWPKTHSKYQRENLMSKLRVKSQKQNNAKYVRRAPI